MAGARQVQLMLLLQPRLEQLQPQLPAWGRAGVQGRAPGKGLGRRQGEQPGPGHPSSPIWASSHSTPAQVPHRCSGA